LLSVKTQVLLLKETMLLLLVIKPVEPLKQLVL
jgi:hypothetical protein